MTPPRNSPQWDDTLFILTFDEHGGFADHVPLPVRNIPTSGLPSVASSSQRANGACLVGVPAGDNLTYTEKAPDGKQITFNFDRLGLRVPHPPHLPWVRKDLSSTVVSTTAST